MKLRISLLLLLPLIFGCYEEVPINEKKVVINGPKGQLLDSLLTPYLEQLRSSTDNTAGLAIGVIKGENIVYARTFGYAQLDSKREADFDTPFHIASLSKPFSAVAIAKLIREGKLNLDDLVVDFIPEFKMKGAGYDKVTIQQILTHTSGIPRNIASDDWLNPSYGPHALEENLAIIEGQELNFEPGQEFSYSNSAFDILGIVISRVTNLPFHEYIRQEIFEPLKMSNASFIRPKDTHSAAWAQAYSYGLNTQILSPYPYNERLFPSSGLVASLQDMLYWCQFYLGKGSINGKEILDEAHFNLVIAPQYDTPWGDKIGLSWFLQSYLNRPIIMHTGFDTGFEAMLYIYPEEAIAIVVLANRDFSRTGRIINATSEILFDKLPKDYELSAKYKFADIYKKEGIEPAKRLWTKLKRDTLDNYFTDDDDLLTTGAILENGGHWQASKEILTYYLELNEKSTYAWRLLGNANLGLRDTTTAVSCYEQTLKINPQYEKGRIALEKLGLSIRK